MSQAGPPTTETRAHHAATAGGSRPGVGRRVAFRAVLPLVAVLVLYTAMVALDLAGRDAVENLDLWYYTSLSDRIDFSVPATLANGLYPLGYPLLLRLAMTVGLDVLRVGQMLSMLGGALALVAVYAVLLRWTKRPVVAAAGPLLLLANAHFIGFAGFESTDMLAAGLQLGALALLLAGATDRRRLVAAGAVLGLAYLVRYTAVVLLPVAVLYAAVAPGPPRRRLGTAALVAAAFVAVAGGQLAASGLAHGAPFFHEQAKNIWFGIYGEQDWASNWSKVPNDITLPEVVRQDPALFVRHVATELTAGLLRPLLWPWPLHLLWLGGAVALATDRRIAGSDRALTLGWMLVPLGATSLAWMAPRFLMVPLGVQTLLIVTVLDRLAAGRERRWMAAGLTAALLLVALAVPRLHGELSTHFQRPVRDLPARVNHVLRAAGMDNPRTVGTNDPYLHAVDTSARTRYEQTLSFAPNPRRLNDILEDPRASYWRFLVLHHASPMGDSRAIRAEALSASDRLRPLLLEGDLHVFCVEPCP